MTCGGAEWCVAVVQVEVLLRSPMGAGYLAGNVMGPSWWENGARNVPRHQMLGVAAECKMFISKALVLVGPIST